MYATTELLLSSASIFQPKHALRTYVFRNASHHVRGLTATERDSIETRKDAQDTPAFPSSGF
jgi:hypothetical protein